MDRQTELFSQSARSRILRAVALLRGAESDLSTADPMGRNPKIRSAMQQVHEATDLLSDANRVILSNRRQVPT